MRASVLPLVLATAGCGTLQPYFEPVALTSVVAPHVVDEPVYVGVAFLAAHAGDTVVLTGVEPVDPFGHGAQLTWHALDTVNGISRSQQIPMRVVICVDDPAPADCVDDN